MAELEESLSDAEATYGKLVGNRLRTIRRQKRMSLQDVEAESGQEFKASVLGAYERGERAISIPRLQRLAAFYSVPVNQLLPRGVAEVGERQETRTGHKVTIDLHVLEDLDHDERGMLTTVPQHDPDATAGLQRPDADHPPRRPPGAGVHPRP